MSSSAAELLKYVFLQTDHGSAGDETSETSAVWTLEESSFVPAGLGGIVQTESEVKRAISAGVWGAGLTGSLSGCRVRGMGLEC